MTRRAIIIGHTGQDGSYLKELLVSKGYKVTGLSSTEVYHNFDIGIRYGNVSDQSYTDYLISEVKPNEVYYLAALHQSSIEKSHSDLDFYKKSIEINSMGLLNVLNSIHSIHPSARLFYAASSHIFGNTPFEIQNEQTPYCPVSIYGISKVLGMQLCDLYVQKGVFCSVGIFYNHESPRRDSKFVSKKIVDTAVDIFRGWKDKLELGDLSAKIDWGYAPDYVNAAYLMLQNDTPGNYIVSSGELHTVQDFVEEVFKCLGLDWDKYVVENRNIILKKSVTLLRGDSTKLRTETGWKNSISFKDMIGTLVKTQLEEASS